MINSVKKNKCPVCGKNMKIRNENGEGTLYHCNCDTDIFVPLESNE